MPVANYRPALVISVEAANKQQLIGAGSRRAAQRLGRLTEGAQERAPHAFGIAEPGMRRNVLDRRSAALDFLARRFEAQPLFQQKVSQ